MREIRALLLALCAGLVAGTMLAGPVLGQSPSPSQPQPQPEVHVPGPVPADGTPVEMRVSLDEVPESGAEVKVWLGGPGWQASRTWNGTAFQRSDHYAFEARGPGSWSGWVPVRANPDSVNHDRLTSDDRVQVGVRVRTPSGTGEALEELTVLDPVAHRPVAAEPGQALVVRAGGDALRRTNLDGELRVLDVAVPPGVEARICARDPCPAPDELRLERVGGGFARLHNAGSTAANLSTSVLVLAEHRCPLTGALPPGEGLALEPASAPNGSQDAARWGPCQPREEDTPPGLWQRGLRVDRAPDPPGWGDAVRDPVDGAWAPWRLPRGVAPSPLEGVDVDGPMTTFDTREHGLDRALQVIDGARERLLATTYLLTNEHVVAALEDAARRGVDVRVVLEPSPVGGTPEATDGLVERLREAGATVRWFGGSVHEHGLQHAKVLVADGSVLLVLTENFTHSGLPDDGTGNLGLGIGVVDPGLAGRVEHLFGVEGPARRWHPAGWQRLDATVTLVTAPENAWRVDGVPAWIEEAGRVDGLVLRLAPDWGPRPNAWLSALVNASREHPVRVLASGHPEGAREDNRVGLSALEGPPRAGPVSTRLSDPRQGTVHAKALVGTDAALVGSTNWGLGGVLLNREVNLLVEHPHVAASLGEVFDRAWNGTSEPDLGLPRPVSAPAMGCLAAALAAAALRRRRRSCR